MDLKTLQSAANIPVTIQKLKSEITKSLRQRDHLKNQLALNSNTTNNSFLNDIHNVLDKTTTRLTRLMSDLHLIRWNLMEMMDTTHDLKAAVEDLYNESDIDSLGEFRDTVDELRGKPDQRQPGDPSPALVKEFDDAFDNVTDEERPVKDLHEMLRALADGLRDGKVVVEGRVAGLAQRGEEV